MKRGMAVPILASAVLLASALCANGATQTITVHGISGNVQNIDVARPGDIVTVNVCPADLINYEYTIEKGEEVLKEGFPIVGVGTVFDPSAANQQAILGTPSISTSALTSEEETIFKEYLEIRSKLTKELGRVRTAAQAVSDAESASLFRNMTACTAWPADITNLAGTGTADPPFEATYKQRLDAITRLEDRIQQLAAKIRDRELAMHLRGETPSTFLGQIGPEVQGLTTATTALKQRLDGARRSVSRWAAILAQHPTPSLSQSYLMPKTSIRYTITVKRRPLTPQGRQEVTPDVEVAKIQSSVIASPTFENRALHRLNLSLGIAGTFREDSRSFSLVPTSGELATQSYKVQETSRDEIEEDGVALLGFYLRPGGVDHFAADRGVAWMVQLGSEIAGSPEQYFLGLGADTPQGIVFGFGVTEYEGISPADGWSNRTVAAGADGKPIVATVPTSQRDKLGAYVFLGFRPAIFKAFWDRRKP